VTTYTVVWHEQALDELAAIWAASDRQQAVTESVSRIDRILRTDPAVKGVDFYGDRLLVVVPLAVVYLVKEQDRIVEVLTATELRTT
jgi:hypothetical protein